MVRWIGKIRGRWRRRGQVDEEDGGTVPDISSESEILPPPSGHDDHNNILTATTLLDDIQPVDDRESIASRSTEYNHIQFANLEEEYRRYLEHQQGQQGVQAIRKASLATRSMSRHVKSSASRLYRSASRSNLLHFRSSTRIDLKATKHASPLGQESGTLPGHILHPTTSEEIEAVGSAILAEFLGDPCPIPIVRYDGHAPVMTGDQPCSSTVDIQPSPTRSAYPDVLLATQNGHTGDMEHLFGGMSARDDEQHWCAPLDNHHTAKLLEREEHVTDPLADATCNCGHGSDRASDPIAGHDGCTEEIQALESGATCGNPISSATGEPRESDGASILSSSTSTTSDVSVDSATLAQYVAQAQNESPLRHALRVGGAHLREITGQEITKDSGGNASIEGESAQTSMVAQTTTSVALDALMEEDEEDYC